MDNRVRFALVMGSLLFLAGQEPVSKLTPSERADIEKAVSRTHAHTLLYAEQLNLDKAMSSMLENDKGSFIRDGELLMTREDVLSVFKQAYAGLQKQDIEVGRQNVIALSPDIALLIGEGTSSATTTDGRTFSSRWAETVVYVRVDNEWKVLHAHQSIPRRG